VSRVPITRAAAAVTAAIAALGVLTACGGSPSTAAPSAAASGTARSTVAFARCVRSHGVPDFPDPGSNGVFDKNKMKQLGVSKAQLRAAATACQNLLPAGPAPLTARQQQDYLRAAACMRSHGIINFPDPTFSDGTVSLPIPSSMDTKSQQFTRARQTCVRIIPPGLPYSTPGGGS
jgi:hypothetical protein